MEEFLMEIVDKNVDSKGIVSIFLSTANTWIRGIKIISLANESVRYTYYEINKKDNPPTKKLIERLTPIDFVLEVKVELRNLESYKDLDKVLSLEYIPELEEKEDDGDSFELI